MNNTRKWKLRFMHEILNAPEIKLAGHENDVHYQSLL